jgi:hypothetical protein
MSTAVNDKKQNFFKAVTSANDRQDLIKSLILAQSLLQLKQEGVKTQGPQDLTILRAVRAFDDGLSGKFVTGPPLPQCEVTVAFDLAKAMFFCTGKIIQVNEGDYALHFKKIFELQRRDAYRVNIAPDLIAAKFAIGTVGGKAFDQDYRISDLSTGGLGLATTEEGAALLPTNQMLLGLIRIGAHQAVEVSAKVKYHRRVTSEKIPYVHVGCEFQNMSSSLSQKIGFLVNDCHRVSFSRISK